MFFQEVLYVYVVKFFSHVDLLIFRTSSIVLNYFCNRSSYFISTLGFERYGPRILVQHVNDNENVMVTFVESCIKTYPHPLATGHHIRKLRQVENFFLA